MNLQTEDLSFTVGCTYVRREFLAFGKKTAQTSNMYFNYHAKAKKLIAQNRLTDCAFVDKWNDVQPALVLFFDNAAPMPIRQHRWQEYLPLIAEKGFEKVRKM